MKHTSTSGEVNIKQTLQRLNRIVHTPFDKCKSMLINRDLSPYRIVFNIPHKIDVQKFKYMMSIGIIVIMDEQETIKFYQENVTNNKKFKKLKGCFVEVTDVDMYYAFKQAGFKFPKNSNILITKLMMKVDNDSVTQICSSDFTLERRHRKKEKNDDHTYQYSWAREREINPPIYHVPWYNCDKPKDADFVGVTDWFNLMICQDEMFDSFQDLMTAVTSSNMIPVTDMVSYFMVESLKKDTTSIRSLYTPNDCFNKRYGRRDEYRIVKHLIETSDYFNAKPWSLSTSIYIYLVDEARERQNMDGSLDHYFEALSNGNVNFDDHVDKTMDNKVKDYILEKHLLSILSSPFSKASQRKVKEITNEGACHRLLADSLKSLGCDIITTCEFAIDVAGYKVDQDAIEAHYISGENDMLFHKICCSLRGGRMLSNEVQLKLLSELKNDKIQCKCKISHKIFGKQKQNPQVLSTIVMMIYHDLVNKEMFYGVSNILDHLMMYFAKGRSKPKSAVQTREFDIQLE